MSGIGRRELLAGAAGLVLAAGSRETETVSPWTNWWAGVCRDLEAGVAPGAACRIRHRGEVVVDAFWGRAQVIPTPEPLRRGMVWDLASLTKPLATTSCIMALVEDGRLDLDAPVAEHLPELVAWGGDEKAAITPRHLLTHSAGFPAWVRFYRDTHSREEVRERLFRTPLDGPPGSRCVYSDLGFMTLGFLVEAVAGRREDVVLRERLTAPRGLADRLRYLPEQPARCVATEQCAQRRRVVRGEVHDENAWACDGVAGHAGLFGTLEGVAAVGEHLLDGTWLAPTTLAEMLRERDDVARGSFWLGWTRHDYGTDDPTCYGHTGFTGTLSWTSRREELVITLLTNRVHPTRENGLLGEARPRWVRRAVEVARAAGR